MESGFIVLITFFSCLVLYIIIYTLYKSYKECNEIQYRISPNRGSMYPEVSIENYPIPVQEESIEQFPE
tara:strand:+ start:552 stop:758 length:207 start_codon:yes stop_codon:yes gene_type:complete